MKAIKQSSDQTQNDHDLLIEINTKLDLFMARQGDQETRIRRLEMWGFLAIGALYAFEVYINFIK